jgi:type IV secretory pathway VirJ component
MALLQWLDPAIANQVQANTNVSGVPLIEVPVVTGASGKRMAVMLSGDGGWAELDRAVAAELAKHGIPTVGWDSLSYFWQAKTPD